jgi:hypothetical protein
VSDPAWRIVSRPRALPGSLTPWFLVSVLFAREGGVSCRHQSAQPRRVGRVIVRTCTSRTPSACWAGWMLVHRPQEHWDREVLDVVVHAGIVHGCRLGTVATIRPSRVRVSAVLGAVNASALCADRYAASGIDRASAQLRIRLLRDGRRTAARAWRMVEFDAGFARAYSVNISSVSHDTPSASHSVHAECVSDSRPQGTIQRHITKFGTVVVHHRCTNSRSWTSKRDPFSATLVLTTGVR